MKGGFGCSPCCGPTCDECTRECTNPHTGDPFEVVYSYKFEGVEAGNPTDGYLTATGDADSSDPYDGMDGNGPWTQAVSADFNYLPSTTRFPCLVRVSFWRSQFLLGAATTPAPSEALDSQTITITNNGSGDIVIVGDFENEVVLAPGESYTGTGIPLVSGSGDQSTNRPRFYEGIASFRPACGNDSVNVNITAEIQWSVKKRQHILYGIVLECYEENPTDCESLCGVDPPAGALYVSFSNLTYTAPSGMSQSEIDYLQAFYGSNETRVVDLIPNMCAVYWYSEHFPPSGHYQYIDASVVNANDRYVGAGLYPPHPGNTRIRTDKLITQSTMICWKEGTSDSGTVNLYWGPDLYTAILIGTVDISWTA